MQGARGEGKGGERAREVNVFIFPPRSSSRFFERGARHRSTWFVDRDPFSSRINYLVLSFSRYWKNLNLARLAYRAVYFHRKYLIFVATKICFSIFLIFKLENSEGNLNLAGDETSYAIAGFLQFLMFQKKSLREEFEFDLLFCKIRWTEMKDLLFQV